MKRSKKMFTRITSMLHNAVEALAPEMTLLEQFRYHWKCVTQFFLDASDERMSVESTTIPHHLEQMIQVLQSEEQEQSLGSTGPSMEFMLQHKILETIQTLGRADCPPGMKRQVLIFFTKLLGKSKQQLLPHVNVHKPVNKLIRCCGEVKAAPTESEEVQFLLQVSSKLKQDSYLVNFFLEKPSSTDSGSSPPISPGIEHEREKPEYSLVDSLLALTKSEDSRVAIKACEGLLLCTSILEDQAASVIVLYTAFCERMADQLCKLFRSLPAIIEPADMNQLSATWGFDHEDPLAYSFPGKRQMIAFFSWLDYVNQLSVEAHPMVTKALALAIRERFILTAIEPGLAQASEPCAITVTAVLTRCLKLVSSATLAQEFADILLGNDMHPEVPEHQSPHKLHRLLIQRINHLSDQLAVETLRLFQALLHLPYQPIIDTLITRNFTHRNYLDWTKVKLNTELNKENKMTTIESSTPTKEARQTNNETEELSCNTNVDDKITVGSHNDLNHLNNLNSLETPVANNSDISVDKDNNGECFEKEEAGVSNTELAECENLNNASSSSDQVQELKEEDDEIISNNNFQNDDLIFDNVFSKKRVEKIVNGFLLLLPDALKTSMVTNETGYDSYLRDAHKQCQQREAQTFTYNWPSASSLKDEPSSEIDNFYEGAFLHTILKRLQRILYQPFDINLELTATISLLCQFRHPFLHEFLLDTSGLIKDSVLNPNRILQSVCQDLKTRAQSIPNFTQSLLAVRRNLVGIPEQMLDIPDESVMEGVILLEEFCKELAAIAFVTTTMDQEQSL